jgi:hypothetical protein
MPDWGFFEWLTYASIGIAAVILVLDQSIKGSSEMMTTFSKLLSSKFWNFAPLALIAISVVLLVAHQVGLIGVKSESKISVQFQKWPKDYKPIAIVGKSFTNEKVLMDGYSYVDCEFNNVTFVYNGTTAIQMVGSKIAGPIRFDSENPAVMGTILLLKGFGAIGDNFKVDIGPNNRLEPAKRIE